jgi:hypothetical protein
LAVAAQVKAMEHRTASWAEESRVCVDRILELYTGVACSLCDPDWPRYSAREDHQWVVAVQEENCHYMWSACGQVLQRNMSAYDFCTSVANIVKTGELEKFFDLPPPTSDDAFTTTTTTTTTMSTSPSPKPVVAVVRHSKQRRFRLRGSHPRLRPALTAKASAVSRGSESPEFVVAPGAANATSQGTEESTESSNDTSSTNSSAGEDEEESDEDEGSDEGEDEDDGEDAAEDAGEDEDDDAEATNVTDAGATNVTIAANATAPPEVVETDHAPAPAPVPAPAEPEEEPPAACTGPAGNPCSIPFPPIAFSAEAHALSAVDEGKFGGYVRSSAAVFALVALVGGAS